MAVPAALNMSATKSICALSLCFVLLILISTPHYNLWIITDLLWRRLNCRQARNWVTRAGLVCCREPLWEETRLVSKCVGCYGDLIRDFFCETCCVEPFRWSLLGVTAMRKMINYLSAVCHSYPERQSSDSSCFMCRPNPKYIHSTMIKKHTRKLLHIVCLLCFWIEFLEKSFPQNVSSCHFFWGTWGQAAIVCLIDIAVLPPVVCLFCWLNRRCFLLSQQKRSGSCAIIH